MVQLLNSIYLGAAKPEDYGKAAGVVELLPFDYYLGAAVPSHGKPTINVLLSGVSPLTLLNAIELNYIKAFGKCEQRNLPEGYTELDSITMDSGICAIGLTQPTANGRIELDFTTTTLDSTTRNFYGGRYNNSSTGAGIRLTHNSSKDIIAYGFDTNSTGTGDYRFQNNTRYKYIYDNGTLTLISGGSTVYTQNFTINDTTTSDVVINGYKQQTGNIIPNSEAIIVNSYKVYNTQGVLVENWKPALKGTTVCFYETVSGTDILPYTGTFAAGSEAVPTPDAPMDIISNNGVIKVKDADLPLGYKRILGLTMNNDCYYKIDDFHLTGADTLKFSYSYTGTACNVLGGYTSSSAQDNLSLYIGTNTSAKYLRYNGGAYSSYSVADKRYDVQITPTGSIGMETEATWTEKSFTCPVEFLIGTTGESATSSKLVGNLYGNIEVVGRLNLIPCERESDNEIGYYDTYTNTFFEPIGTTPVSLGYDNSHMTEIYADGTVETINVHGTNLLDLANCVDGYYYSPTGEYNPAASARLSNFIPVKAGVTYTVFAYGSAGSANVRVNLLDTQKNWLSQEVMASKLGEYIAISVTPTQDGYLAFSANYITTSYIDWSLSQVVRGAYTVATMPEYAPYYDGGTATAEMLLKVGNYKDVQSIIDGTVTRNVGVKVLDGTEEIWGSVSQTPDKITILTNCYTVAVPLGDAPIDKRRVYCTHLISSDTLPDANARQGYALLGNGGSITPSPLTDKYAIGLGLTTRFPTIAGLKQWLADQYAAGTPVIVIYPLATPTTESVTGQTLTITQGTNIVTAEGSVSDLELEISYKAYAEVTVEEIEAVNTDENVEVTIS